MTWEEQLLMVFQLLFAAILGGVIGLEREKHVGLSGIRTHAAVALGACLFGLISFNVHGPADPSRIAAQIVSGIGFLGAGVILRDHGRVRGMTTAATLWATASIGLSIANSMYIVGIAGTIIILGLLALPNIPGWSPWKRQRNKEIDDKQRDYSKDD